MKYIIIILSLLIFSCTTESVELTHHDINVILDIPSTSIQVVDNVILKNVGEFRLNKDLEILSVSDGFEISLKGEQSEEANYYLYELKGPAGKEMTIKYGGKLGGGINKGAAEYARGFSDSDGIISNDGVFLAGQTNWLPIFNEELFSFDLTVESNKDWIVVSQGDKVIDENKGDKRITKYSENSPMDEVFLISNKWKTYTHKIGRVEIQAFLRSDDQELAERYFGVSEYYLKKYEALIDVYPYNKFAIVENFWETGWGMPSFTLLGEKVIRFPFILHSSYPHELLHNWWGNSVYVDTEYGNWCEGITAYMADHLIKEEQGLGADYRRTILEKYSNFVNEENEISVSEFLSRNNPAEEAVGYGKVAMINHMLRKKYGDELFFRAYSEFYVNNKFKRANFKDIFKSFESVTGDDLDPFFNEWVMGKGAPEISGGVKSLEGSNGYYILRYWLEQKNKKVFNDLTVPIHIVYEDAVDTINVELGRKILTKTELSKKPIKLLIDPDFDVFRKLDKDEKPITLSNCFGESNASIILPTRSDYLNEFKSMAETFKGSQESQGKELNIFSDDISEFPITSVVWILGNKNKFNDLQDQIDQDDFGELSAQINSNKTVIYTVKNPNNKDQIICFIGVDNKDAIAALTRKLPHYGKYSYLGFEGAEANNILKGVFPITDSPMVINIEK